MSTESEDAYWGEPVVTPEREEAWRVWQDNYIAAVVDSWIAHGSSREDVLAAIEGVIADVYSADNLPWMKLGVALTTRVNTTLSSKPLDADGRREFTNALRTIETATAHERNLATAYHLGVSVQRAAEMRDHIADALGRDRDHVGRTALYRHFDQDGVLLYVGIAKEPDKRGEQHSHRSKWHRFRADTQIEWFDSRDQAAAAEREAIQREAPLFNQTHNKANRAAAIDYLLDALEVASTAGSSTRVVMGGAA